MIGLRFLGRTIALPTARPGWWPRPRQPDQPETINEPDAEHTALVPSRVVPGVAGPEETEHVWARPEAADHWDATAWHDYPPGSR